MNTPDEQEQEAQWYEADAKYAQALAEAHRAKGTPWYQSLANKTQGAANHSAAQAAAIRKEMNP